MAFVFSPSLPSVERRSRNDVGSKCSPQVCGTSVNKSRRSTSTPEPQPLLLPLSRGWSGKGGRVSARRGVTKCGQAGQHFIFNTRPVTTSPRREESDLLLRPAITARGEERRGRGREERRDRSPVTVAALNVIYGAVRRLPDRRASGACLRARVCGRKWNNHN